MTPIAPLITGFLRQHLPIDRGCSLHTCETYAHAFRLLFAFVGNRLKMRPSQICIEQIQQLREIPGLHGIHLMAIEWEYKIPEIVKGAGLYLSRLTRTILESSRPVN